MTTYKIMQMIRGEIHPLPFPPGVFQDHILIIGLGTAGLCSVSVSVA